MGLLTDDFVWNRAVDDTNDVPQRGSGILLLVVKIDNHVIRGRSDIVLDTFVPQTGVACPILIKVLCLGSMPVEGFEDWQGIKVRDRD